MGLLFPFLVVILVIYVEYGIKRLPFLSGIKWNMELTWNIYCTDMKCLKWVQFQTKPINASVMGCNFSFAVFIPSAHIL